MSNRPKWMDKEPTRVKSKKQETRIASDYGGYTTINSGATFGQNDVESKDYSFEAKTTSKKSYAIKPEEFSILVEKTDVKKIPVFLIDFETYGESFVVLREQDFKAMVGLPPSTKPKKRSLRGLNKKS